MSAKDQDAHINTTDFDKAFWKQDDARHRKAFDALKKLKAINEEPAMMEEPPSPNTKYTILEMEFATGAEKVAAMKKALAALTEENEALKQNIARQALENEQIKRNREEIFHLGPASVLRYIKTLKEVVEEKKAELAQVQEETAQVYAQVAIMIAEDARRQARYEEAQHELASEAGLFPYMGEEGGNEDEEEKE